MDSCQFLPGDRGRYYNSKFPVHFTNANLDRARRARVLHRYLHHPCNAYLFIILDNDVISKDLRNYRLINGPCKECLIGKSRQPSSQRVSSVTYPLGHLLIFFFYGASGRKEPYLISVESRTGHIVTARLPTNERATTFEDIFNFYKFKGHSVKLIRTDHEANPLAEFPCSATARGVMSSKLTELSAPSKTGAEQPSLVWVGLFLVHQHLIVDAVQSMNDTVDVNSAPSTLITLVSDHV